MPKKALIAIDIDGTLLGEKYELFHSTAAYLSKLSDEGFCIVLSSGRPYRAMKGIYDELRCRGPLICYNGARVFSPCSNLKQQCSPFHKEEVSEILMALSPYLEGWQVEDETSIYRHGLSDELEDFFPSSGMKLIDGASIELPVDPYSVVFKEKKRNDEAFLSVLSKYKGMQWRHWTASPYSELHLEGVSKGKALAFIMDELGYHKEEVFAFGDSDNDHEMLLQAGHPFAMANSKSKRLLKEFPVTEKGNSEEGVAYELRKHF